MNGIRIYNKVLIEGQDFHLHFVKFPNRANPAQVWPNPDGTYDIYINALYWAEEDRMKQEFRHELRHIILRHFEAVGLTIEEIEAEADGKLDGSAAQSDGVERGMSLHDFLHPPAGYVPCFASEAAMGRWLTRIMKVYNISAE